MMTKEQFLTELDRMLPNMYGAQMSIFVLAERYAQASVVEYMEKNPQQAISFMLLYIGRECKKSNVGGFDMEMEFDHEGERFKVVSHNKIEKVVS